MILSLESSDEIAGYLAGQELSKKEILKPEQFLEQIEKVTAEEIRQVAKKIFVNDKLNLAIIGTADDKAYLEKILKL